MTDLTAAIADLKAAIARVEKFEPSSERDAVLVNLNAQLAGTHIAYPRDEDIETDIAHLERLAAERAQGG